MTERDDLVERVATAILHRRAQEDYHTVDDHGAWVVDHDKELARAAIAECEKDRSEDYEQLLGAYRRLEVQAAAMRAALGFAEKQYRGFASVYGTQDCEAYNRMKDALAPDAGRKVLDVVRAAKALLELLRDHIPHADDGEPLFDSEEEASEFHVAEKALSALGWEP